jgi:hypothetical protein
VRNYVEPGIGSLWLDRLQVTDVQAWLNGLATQCRCCAQGRGCPSCAACHGTVLRCGEVLSSGGVITHNQGHPNVSRSGLNSAVCQELLDRNVAQLVQIPKQRKRRLAPWMSQEARRFLESARSSSDPLYAACVLVLVLGLDKAAMSGMGSHASDASVFVSRAGPVLRGRPGCRRCGRCGALGLVASGGDRRRGGLDCASAAHVHAVVVVGACHRHCHRCVVLAQPRQVT